TALRRHVECVGVPEPSVTSIEGAVERECPGASRERCEVVVCAGRLTVAYDERRPRRYRAGRQKAFDGGGCLSGKRKHNEDDVAIMEDDGPHRVSDSLVQDHQLCASAEHAG